MSNVSPMTWTPEAYVKILEVDLKELNERFKEIRYKLAVGSEKRSFAYSIGEFLQMAGKVQDNAKLLHQSLHASR